MDTDLQNNVQEILDNSSNYTIAFKGGVETVDENGIPKKFTGRLGKYDEVSRSGSVFIEEFGRNPIYYHGPHMKSADLVEGTTFSDIEIGYSNIAPKAFREIELKE